MDRMIINLTLNLQGDVTSVKEWIDTIQPGAVVHSEIVRTTRFTENKYSDVADCKHFKRIELKLNVPIKHDAIGHRLSPTSICAEYIDELMHNYQFRNANKGRTEVPSVEDHETKFAHWKPNTSLPYWVAETRDNAVVSMFNTNSYIKPVICQ
jgi:hypothetical protein